MVTVGPRGPAPPLPPPVPELVVVAAAPPVPLADAPVEAPPPPVVAELVADPVAVAEDEALEASENGDESDVPQPNVATLATSRSAKVLIGNVLFRSDTTSWASEPSRFASVDRTRGDLAGYGTLPDGTEVIP